MTFSVQIKDPADKYLPGLSPGDLAMQEIDGLAATDAAYISAWSSRLGTGPGVGMEKPEPSLPWLASLQLDAVDVAKVTRSATTHLAFHPTSETLLLAAGDKEGNLSLWYCAEAAQALDRASSRGDAGSSEGELRVWAKEGAELARLHTVHSCPGKSSCLAFPLIKP